jgi:hypothetical protein
VLATPGNFRFPSTYQLDLPRVVEDEPGGGVDRERARVDASARRLVGARVYLLGGEAARPREILGHRVLLSLAVDLRWDRNVVDQARMGTVGTARMRLFMTR